jgi:hypothetical protein
MAGVLILASIGCNRPAESATHRDLKAVVSSIGSGSDYVPETEEGREFKEAWESSRTTQGELAT